jgi:hypothetical protein
MKVKFKSNWFGPTEFKGPGYFSPSGQRFKRGLVYELNGEILDHLPKSAVIIDDGEEKSVEQFNKEDALRELEEAKASEALAAKQQQSVEDQLKNARSVAARNRAKKQAEVSNEKHGVS